MTRITPAFWLLLAGLLASQAAVPAVRYFDISGSTAVAENACPVWVPAGNLDDCSYNASNPSTTGTAQWIGPVFGAGYYAPGEAPLVFTNPAAPAPVTASAPLLPLGGKTGIPIARGFVSIDDKGTPDGTDDVIGGTIEFGPFERNVGTGPATRMLESFDRIIHRIIPPAVGGSNVNDATPNAAGGLDYVVGLSGSAAVFPSPLSGSSDPFPSEVASQSSSDPGDTPYWAGPGVNGIARFEGSTAIAGLRTDASVWGYGCSAGAGAVPCVTTEVNWNADSRARFDNVLLSLSTDDAGHITAASAYLVNESDLSSSVAGNDSWNATTLSFTGSEDPLPDAFEDRALLTNGVDLSVDIPVLVNDVPGVAPVAVTIPAQAGHGDAVVLTQPANSVNVVRYTPTPPTFEGVDTFTYLVTDANDDTSTGTVAVTLTDPITCANDTQTVAQNTPTTIDVLANDAGFDIPPVVVTIVSPPAQGTAVANADGTVTYTSPDGVAANDEASVEDFVTRSIGVLTNDLLTGSTAFTYRVNDGTNRPPLPCAVTVDVAGTSLLVAPVVIEITALPAHGQAFVLPEAGTELATIQYTSNAGYVGQDTLRYRIRDGAGFVSEEATVTMTVSDSTPVANNDSVTAEDGAPTSIFVTINDTNGVDVPLTLAITSEPAHGTATVVAASGSSPSIISYTSATGFAGTDTLSYTITDADGDVSNAASVTITVRESTPVANPDTVNGDARTESALDVMINDAGTVDVPITIEITQTPAAGTARVIPASGTTTGRPVIGYASNPGTNAPDSLRYRLRDADGDVSGEVTVTINVTDATPVANDDPSVGGPAIVVEDGTTFGIAILSNDTGRGNRPLTVTITQQPANGTAKIVTGTPLADPIVNYKPDTGFVGGDTFRYRVTDGDGDASNEAVVTLTVQDSAPVANADTGNGDSRTSTAVDVLLNDTGLSDGPVTIEITGQPANGTADLVTIALANGGRRPGIGYASNPGFAGPDDVVRYRVRDQDGDVSDETTLTLSVANLTPVAVNDTAGVTEALLPNDQTYVIERIRTPFDVLRNDTGRGNRPNTIEITQVPQHGEAQIDLAEVTGIGRPGISYTSDEGYTGPDSFSYTVTDGDDQVSNVATVNFQVANILTAVDDSVRTNTGRSLPVDVLANDGGLAEAPISVEILVTANGSATVNPDNTVTFQPDSGFSGTGGFRYRLTDGFNQQSEAAAFVDILPPPVTKQNGGGSALNAGAIALLLAGMGLRDRRRRRIPA